MNYWSNVLDLQLWMYSPLSVPLSTYLQRAVSDLLTSQWHAVNFLNWLFPTRCFRFPPYRAWMTVKMATHRLQKVASLAFTFPSASVSRRQCLLLCAWCCYTFSDTKHVTLDGHTLIPSLICRRSLHDVWCRPGVLLWTSQRISVGVAHGRSSDWGVFQGNPLLCQIQTAEVVSSVVPKASLYPIFSAHSVGAIICLFQLRTETGDSGIMSCVLIVAV